MSDSRSLGIPRRVARARMLTTRTLGSVRRRQTKQGNILLQDVDSGKPCLGCKDCKDGFALHVWRKKCRNCFCKREDHDIGIVVDDPTDVPNMQLKNLEQGKQDPKISRTGRKWRAPSTTQRPLGAVAEVAEEELEDAFEATSLTDAVVEENDSPYAWIPEGLTKPQVEKFMDLLPVEARPANTLEGQQERARRRLHQLPPHDANAEDCNDLDKAAVDAMQSFVQARDTKDIGKGDVLEEVEVKSCVKCSQTINVGDMSISSERLPSQSFHPQCFTCTECNEFLADLIHFVHNDKPYCGRHHAELILPRCGGCDELIFQGTYTVAQGKKWHPDHFCCIFCDRPLAAEKSEEFVKSKGNVVCLTCFDEKIAKNCLTCDVKIGAGEEQLSSGDNQWHSKCFTCSACDVTLDPSQFLMKDKKLLCPSCYATKFGADCAVCKEPIDASQRSLGAGDKKWHAACFTCAACSEALAGKKFVDHSAGLFCVACYEEKHATRCKACAEVMGESGGLRYKDDVYHEKCFVCSFCQGPLAGKKFVRKEDKFCCQPCHAEKVAPKCHSCGKAISRQADGDEDFIAHEKTSWHVACFACAHCAKKLEGERYLFEDSVLTCGRCK